MIEQNEDMIVAVDVEGTLIDKNERRLPGASELVHLLQTLGRIVLWQEDGHHNMQAVKQQIPELADAPEIVGIRGAIDQAKALGYEPTAKAKAFIRQELLKHPQLFGAMGRVIIDDYTVYADTLDEEIVYINPNSEEYGDRNDGYRWASAIVGYIQRSLKVQSPFRE